MKITKIVPKKFKKEYVTVFLDSASEQGLNNLKLHKEIAAKHHLEENMEIEPDQLAQISAENEKKQALEYALLFLSYRSRSEKEMVERLRKKGFNPETVAETLEELKKQKLIDDFEFAKNLTESRARHKLYGNYRIRQELRQKGISDEVSEKITRELESQEQEDIPGEEERAAQLLEKRAAQMRNLDSHTAYRRLHSFLLRRGFSYDTVERALNRFRRT